MASTKGLLNELYRQVHLAGPMVISEALRYKWDKEKQMYVEWTEGSKSKQSDEEDIE